MVAPRHFEQLFWYHFVQNVSFSLSVIYSLLFHANPFILIVYNVLKEDYHAFTTSGTRFF